MKTSKRALSLMYAAVIIAVVVVGGVAAWYYMVSQQPPPPAKPNVPPIVVVSVKSTSAQVGEPVTCSAKGSTDPDGNITKYTWYFGDGQTGIGETVNHSYSVSGDYIIYVEALDNGGNTSNSLRTPKYLTVLSPATKELKLDLPPVPVMAASELITVVNKNITFDGASSFHYTLVGTEVRSSTTNVVAWNWDFGDGTNDSGKIVNHSYTKPGSYVAKLTVKDKLYNKTGAAGRTILVSAQPVPYTKEIRNPDTIVRAETFPSGLHLELLEMGEFGNRWVAFALADQLLFYLPGATEPTTERGLAESYNVSADGLIYTFKLKKGIKFWDGTELKAEDVVYTYHRAIKMSQGKAWQTQLHQIITGVAFGQTVPDAVLQEHIYATDNYTVVFKLAQAYAAFPGSVAYVGRGIIQKKAAIAAGSWYMGDTRNWAMVRDPMVENVEGILAGKGLICTGPYKVKEWSKGQRILLERFDGYWRGPAPTKYQLGIYVPERSTRMLMFLQKEIDSIGVSAPELQTYVSLPPEEDITVIATKNTGSLYVAFFGFNYDANRTAKMFPDNLVPSDFFNDIHMRKAFCYATNYERYIREVTLGYADRATGTLVPGWPGYYPGFNFEYNLTKAVEELKLAHAGKYYREGFQVAFAWQSAQSTTAYIWGRQLQDAWASIDPKYKVVLWMRRDPEQYDGATPICPIGAENGPEPIWITNIWHSRYGYAGYFGYKNPKVDTLLEAAQWETNRTRSAELYVEAQKLVEQDVPGILMNYSWGLSVTRKYLTGQESNPFWRSEYIYPLKKG